MKGNIYCRNFPKTMHFLQSRIGLKECFVRPSFLNFPIADDTDSTNNNTNGSESCEIHAHYEIHAHFLHGITTKYFSMENIRVRGPFSCLYYTYHRLSPRKEPLFVVGRMGEKKERPGKGGTGGLPYAPK